MKMSEKKYEHISVIYTEKANGKDGHMIWRLGFTKKKLEKVWYDEDFKDQYYERCLENIKLPYAMTAEECDK